MPRGYPKNGKRRVARKAAVAVAPEVLNFSALEPGFVTETRDAVPLYWRPDRECYRVWNARLDAYGQFEVLSRSEFAELERFCRLFSIELTEAED